MFRSCQTENIQSALLLLSLSLLLTACGGGGTPTTTTTAQPLLHPSSARWEQIFT